MDDEVDPKQEDSPRPSRGFARFRELEGPRSSGSNSSHPDGSASILGSPRMGNKSRGSAASRQFRAWRIRMGDDHGRHGYRRRTEPHLHQSISIFSLLPLRIQSVRTYHLHLL